MEWQSGEGRKRLPFACSILQEGRMAIGPNHIAVSRRWDGGGGPRSWRLGLQQPPRSGRSTHSSLTSPSLRAWDSTANGVTSPIPAPTKPRMIPIVCSSAPEAEEQTPMDSSPTAGTSVVTDAGGIRTAARGSRRGRLPSRTHWHGGGVSSEHLPDLTPTMRCLTSIAIGSGRRRSRRRIAHRVPLGSQRCEHLACRPLRA